MIVLNQRSWHPDALYLDREWVIYHYPLQYRNRITPYERFIYYRPAEGAPEGERSTYFGHGVIGVPFEDPHRTDRMFAPITWSEPFRHFVPLVDNEAMFYETETARKPQFQNSARYLSETAFFRILALGGISSRADFSPLVTTESVFTAAYSSPITAPKDMLRSAETIPQGTGYIPSGAAGPDVFESAALQERARKDHQAILEVVRRAVVSKGGACYYNNNIDLFVNLGEQRYLIEAKSLTDPNAAVDRMRYGMGQLFDYGVRYRAELAGALPILAFGARPTPSLSWIGTVLNGNAVAFIAYEGGRLVPLNNNAEGIVFLH